MTFFVCKTCGRSMVTEEKPFCCYFDRMTSIENISDEDAVKMGLFQQLDKSEAFFNPNKEAILLVEFPGDLVWNPFDGTKSKYVTDKTFTLAEFQDDIMERVR